MLTVYFIRHGVTNYNQNRIIQGQLDTPLSWQGQRQAELLAQRMCELGPQALIASTLSRARDTAAPVAAATGLALKTSARWQERHFGDLQGLSLQAVEDREAGLWRRLQLEPDLTRPGGESARAFSWRVGDALDSMLQVHGDLQRIAVVTHGAVLSMLCSVLLGMAPERRAQLRFDNASITRVDFDREGGATAHFINDTHHLSAF